MLCVRVCHVSRLGAPGVTKPTVLAPFSYQLRQDTGDMQSKDLLDKQGYGHAHVTLKWTKGCACGHARMRTHKRRRRIVTQGKACVNQ